ncbi:MAG: zinc-binding alcohol dehydrogenase, partial [Actinomycetota bacterium]|nr:zinc-binding alcohol dehydrogenase [Actinomycetota bacterium]
MGQRSYRSIGVRCRGQAALFEGVLSDPGPGQILVQTLATGLSAGTELSLLKGTDPHHRVGFDPELRVFDALAPTAGYPIPAMGYMEVARVAQSRADGFATGQVVAMAYGHRTAHVADPGQETVVAVPSGLDPLLGVYVAQMGPICANALLHATAEFAGPDGDALGAGVRDRHVLITGAGAVGLLTALFARQHGAADVAVADP